MQPADPVRSRSTIATYAGGYTRESRCRRSDGNGGVDEVRDRERPNGVTDAPGQHRRPGEDPRRPLRPPGEPACHADEPGADHHVVVDADVEQVAERLARLEDVVDRQQAEERGENEEGPPGTAIRGEVPHLLCIGPQAAALSLVRGQVPASHRADGHAVSIRPRAASAPPVRSRPGSQARVLRRPARARRVPARS